MQDFISFQREAEHSEATGNNRWMISYADFMTLLFVLFLVLYAKLPKLVETGVPVAQPLHAPLIPGIRSHHGPLLFQPKPVVPSAIDKQQVLLQELARTFADLMQTGDVALVTRKDGILLEIKDTALFASGTAQPAGRASDVVAKISAVLSSTTNRVVVEGHTDNVPIQTVQFPSNWELSSARAASVVRALQEHGINPIRLTASGLAETKPKSSNETALGRSENRRVSLLVLNN
jgi:chemotaxis protein MotB